MVFTLSQGVFSYFKEIIEKYNLINTNNPMMNIDIFLLISFLLPFAMMGGLFYFTVVRKNNFEERVAHYIPYHALERERKVYMEKVEKYKRYICIGLGIFLSVFIVLPFVIFFVAISKEGVNFSVPEQLTLLMIPLFLFLMIYYLLSYVVKRHAKAQHLLLEEMSKEDFAYLLKVQKDLLWLRKYFPFFILCKEKIYFFTFFTLREIEPKQIKKIRFWNSRRGNRTILIKSSRWFITSMTEIVYPYLRDIVQKYNPTEDIE